MGIGNIISKAAPSHWGKESGFAFPNFFDSLADILLVPGVMVCTIALSTFLERLLHFHSKWTPFLLLGIATPAASQYLFRASRESRRQGFLPVAYMIIFGIAAYSLAWMIIKATNVFGPLHMFPTLAALTIAFAASTIYQTNNNKPGNNLPQPLFATWGILIGLIGLASWAALFQLPNWVDFSRSCSRHPLPAIGMLSICLAAAIHFLLKEKTAPIKRLPFPSSSRAEKALRICGWSALLLGMILLSFRFDTLFMGSSEMHWEYYVGPVRGVRNGGWLLWDIPSQYGFLNILLAAILPTRTSWQAVYILQGILLIPAATILFRAIYTANTERNALFAAGLTISSLFFADPELIGPYLYPSSSVMRFFWCYILIFFLLAQRVGEDRQLKPFIFKGSILWAIGSLWSAESFIYCSCTFFPAILFAIAQNHFREKAQLPSISKAAPTAATYLSIPLLVLGSSIAIISGFYLLRAGHLPDWRVFIEHAISYAGGFGSVEMAPMGAVWILLLLFAAILTVIIRAVQADFHEPYIVPAIGALGCLWGVSSYFIGRAVPNNITAILPVLTLIIAAVLHLLNRIKKTTSGALLKLISVPLTTMILTSGIGNIHFIPRLRTFDALSSDITSRVRIADPSLQELLNKAKIEHATPVVFDGGAAAMPRWTSNGILDIGERTWMPNPVQLLEEPVAPVRRKIYIRRFMARKSEDGFFIQGKGANEGQTEERAPDWEAIIQQTHTPTQVLENARWKAIHYIPNTQERRAYSD